MEEIMSYAADIKLEQVSNYDGGQSTDGKRTQQVG